MAAFHPIRTLPALRPSLCLLLHGAGQVGGLTATSPTPEILHDSTAPPTPRALSGFLTLSDAEAALQPLRALLARRLTRLVTLQLPLAAMLELGNLEWARAWSAGAHLAAPAGRAALRAATARRYSGAYKALERCPHAVLPLPGWLLGPGERLGCVCVCMGGGRVRLRVRAWVWEAKASATSA